MSALLKFGELGIHSRLGELGIHSSFFYGVDFSESEGVLISFHHFRSVIKYLPTYLTKVVCR